MGIGNICVSSSKRFAPLFLFLSITLCGCVVAQTQRDNKSNTFVQPPHNEIAMSAENPGRSIAFTKLVSTIPPGKVLGDIQWSAWHQRVCMSYFPSVFNEKLKSLHYNVIGISSNLFDYKTSSPDLIVGAVITNAMGNFSSKGSKQRSYSITVEWQVYDTTQQQVVYKKTTTGHADMDAYGKTSTDIEAMSRAFSDALSGILEDEAFAALVKGKSQSAMPPAQETSLKNDPSILDGAYITRYKHASKAMPLSEALKSVVTVQVGGMLGSGFVVSGNGLILTNYHVVSRANTVRIITYDGKTLDAQVIKTNSARDVAILHAPGIHLPPLAVNTKKLDIGVTVFAIGSPRGVKFSGTVTNGIISSYRNIRNMDWIQSTAVINPGNSGGPLVDGTGSVIGISTGMLQGTNGIYFYIPIEEAISTLGIAIH